MRVGRTAPTFLVLGVGLWLGACAPTRTVALRVTDDAGRPVHGASIVAIPIAESDIPLPLTMARVMELISSDAVRESAVTDAAGDARLTLFEHPTAIRVSAPPFDPLADSGVAWLWTLDPVTGCLEPPRDHPNPPGLALGTLR